MKTSVTKKFTLTMLTAPLLAALAIGLAETAAAAPAGSQLSDPGTTATVDPNRHGGVNKHEGTLPVRALPASRPGTHLGAREHRVHAGAGPADGAAPPGIAAQPSTATRQPLRLGAAAASAGDCENCGPGWGPPPECFSSSGPVPGCG